MREVVHFDTFLEINAWPEDSPDAHRCTWARVASVDFYCPDCKAEDSTANALLKSVPVEIANQYAARLIDVARDRRLVAVPYE